MAQILDHKNILTDEYVAQTYTDKTILTDEYSSWMDQGFIYKTVSLTYYYKHSSTTS